MTNVYEDDARAVEILNRYLKEASLRPPKLPNKRLISAKVSDIALAGLRRVAKEHGYVHDNHGNISMLLEAIGTGTLTVIQPEIQARRRD